MDLAFHFPERGNANRHVSALPAEMIRYELESQGIKCKPKFFEQKKQLSELLESREYVPGKFFVAMGYKEDMDLCATHLNSWIETYDKTNKSKIPLDLYVTRLRHMSGRISRIAIDLNDSESRSHMEMLKLAVLQLKNKICQDFNLHDATANKTSQLHVSQSQPPKQNLGNIENWSLSNRSPTFGHANTNSSFDNMRPDESVLDYTLEMQNDSLKATHYKNVPKVSSTFYTNPNQTHQPHHFMPSSQSFPSHVSYLPQRKAEIWKWDLKFTGDPNSMSVSEFINRVDELALARGATLEDLFIGAVDLFDGTALKWYRAGKQSNFFADWKHIEKQLERDFQDLEYGDTLWDFIRARLQEPRETIVAFFAVMEDLIGRLNRPATDMVKAVAMRRNLRPEFIHGLGPNQYHDVRSLKEACKIIETNIRRIRARPSHSSRPVMNSFQRDTRFIPNKINSVDIAEYGLDECYQEIPEETFNNNVHFMQTNSYSKSNQSFPRQLPTSLSFNPSIPPPRNGSDNDRYVSFSDERISEKERFPRQEDRHDNYRYNRQYSAPMRRYSNSFASGNANESSKFRMGPALN